MTPNNEFYPPPCTSPLMYRPTEATIEAFAFHGSFPLDFLREGESVRKAASMGRSVIVQQGDREVLVKHGDYLVRDLASGALRKESATDWFRRWEIANG